ncbi:MAG: hypothetical protein QXE76_06580 [Candidatus Bathyarchaeia archaeon]
MQKWWLAIGPPEYWQIAFEQGSIWGLKATRRHNAHWQSLSEGDYILFYATRPISGIIGYGVIRRKFRQNKPLWPQEVEENRVIWPNRFEFDVKYSLPQNRWKDDKIVLDSLKILVRGGFQEIKEEIANEAIISFPKDISFTETFKKARIPLHDEMKAKLLEIGRLQKYIAETEYNMDGAKLDVVWRRIERSVPTYVFEIQIGGDLYHAIGKLKHAFDLWNSNIFLVVTQEDKEKAKSLLTGTFHEILDKIKIIETKQIEELFERKRAYRDLEVELGIA